MDKQHYNEMLQALNTLELDGKLNNKKIYLFGHCNATEELADLLLSKNYNIVAILDNNRDKHGKDYKNISIISPEQIMEAKTDETIVLIVARAYASMTEQLNRMGYNGQIRKLIDYDSFAEYSLSEVTVERMKKREERGEQVLDDFSKRHPGAFKILCPFSALGDIYIMMSYLPYFLKKRNIKKCVIGVVGTACAQVVKLFGKYEIENFNQKDMDEMLQAAIYTQDKNVFIPHQDRPYVVNLHRALYVKCIPLKLMYCCGVFDLPKETVPVKPTNFADYPNLSDIPQNKSVIFSPYAKSVIALQDNVWSDIVSSYIKKGYDCFTNVVGEEKPLDGTKAISPKIAELKSVVERAGTFVGIRSGLCDVIQTANAKKIVLYPDYNYSDTKWKAIDMYRLEGWKNVVVKNNLEFNNIV